MYESEANQITGSASELPQDVLARFAESRRTVIKRTLIPWGEHCTECVWPSCYSSCDLYSPRPDGRCRRFVQGMVRIPHPESLNGYILKISFKRWAKLWSTASPRLYTLVEAERAERSDLKIASCIQKVPTNALRNSLIRKRYSWKKKPRTRIVAVRDFPNCMLIECFNPTSAPVTLTLTVRADNARMPFQALLTMAAGFNRQRIGLAQITGMLGSFSRCDVELIPNEIADGCTLFFGALDFVIDSDYAEETKPDTVVPPTRSGASPRLCKCVIWDLDNTLWDGVLLEDGRQRIRLKDSIPDILKVLDERGILISAASKNNPEDVMSALQDFGLAEYFLFPQIGWMPKSQAVREIASRLNVGIDSLLFVDDSAFERAQVSSQCPEVMVIDAAEYRTILHRPECQSPVTEESRKRRSYYREQQVRDGAQKEFEGDYLAFLRKCQLRLTIKPLEEANLERVHELTQRTNQMNFSGNRYTREQLRQILTNRNIDTYVLDCRDRFGAYGTIGFCTVEGENRMTDLMFSCRIQAKRIEHAFICHILRTYRQHGGKDFYVDYRMTAKNAAPGKVFEDLGFAVVRQAGEFTELVFAASREIPEDGIVDISLEVPLAPTSCS